MEYKTPWNFHGHSWPRIQGNLDTEIAIVGAGISGVATAYYLLKETEKQVLLLDKNKIASGATGNNAGLAVAALEKPVAEVVEEFGLEATKEAFSEIESAWDQLFKMAKEIDFSDNVVEITEASFGATSLEMIIPFMEGNIFQEQFGKPKWKFLIQDDKEIKKRIPKNLLKHVTFVRQNKILNTLKVTDPSYIAAAIRLPPFRIARVNSGKFCHQMVEYLHRKYPKRFSVYENTLISEIQLYTSHSELIHSLGKVHAHEVILCTNGYKDFVLNDYENKEIDWIQDQIIPKEGYLAGFKGNHAAIFASGYLNDKENFRDSPYWYFSCAPFVKNAKEICAIIGGPEYVLAHPSLDEERESQSKKSLESLKEFTKITYGEEPSLDYFWRGIMGYTKNGLRIVGKDPENPHLWYNLGCNGIGFLPGLAGGKRIADLMNGRISKPSIFDPKKI